jgi:prevent-host-death family protein
MKTMAAARAKAQFLGLLDEVKMKREPIVLTKFGKPVAKLVPMEIAEDEDPLDRFLVPGVEIVGDIEAPLYTDAEWQGFFKASLDQLK